MELAALGSYLWLMMCCFMCVFVFRAMWRVPRSVRQRRATFHPSQQLGNLSQRLQRRKPEAVAVVVAVAIYYRKDSTAKHPSTDSTHRSAVRHVEAIFYSADYAAAAAQTDDAEMIAAAKASTVVS